jgi:hypothetical protein
MGSTTANPSDSPLPERLSSVQRDILETIRKNPNLFVLGDELKMFQRVYGTGFKGAVVKLLNAQPTVVLSDVAQTAKCCVMHNVVSSEIALFEQPAEPSHLSAAHQKFLPLENLFSGMCRRLFIYTTRVIDEIESSNEEVTDEEIRKRVYTALKSQLGYNDDEEGQQKAETFVRRALLGFKLGCLWNPMRCTFTPALGFKEGRPLAIMILDIEATDVEVNPISLLLRGRFKVPCSFLESGGIPVPQRVVEVASSARNMAVSAVKTFGGGLNFVMRGVVSFGRNWLPCSAPAAPVEVGINPEIAASPAPVEAAAARSVEEIGEAAQQLSRELGGIAVELSKGPSEAVMQEEKTQEQTVELTDEQEGRLSALLDHSQPLISESLSMVVGEASATSKQLTDFVREEKEKQDAESVLVEEQVRQRLASGVSELSELGIREQPLEGAAVEAGMPQGSRADVMTPGLALPAGQFPALQFPALQFPAQQFPAAAAADSDSDSDDGGGGPALSSRDDRKKQRQGGSRSRKRSTSKRTRRKAPAKKQQSKKNKYKSRRKSRRSSSRKSRKSSRKN